MSDTKRYHIGGSAPKWSDKEKEVLKKKYEDGRKSELMDLLPNRTWKAIKRQAEKLGLRRRRKGDVAHIDTENLSEFELGYIAGFVDGEGTISVTKQGREDGLTLHPLIRISGTDGDVVGKMASWFNKSVNGPYGKDAYEEKRDGNRRDYYSFEIRTWRGVLNILEGICDRLIVKRKQASLVKELCQIRLDNYGEDYTERELELVERIRELNKRGR